MGLSELLGEQRIVNIICFAIDYHEMICKVVGKISSYGSLVYKA